MYQEGVILQLEEDWADFGVSSRSAKTKKAYQELMVRTFPILLEKWVKKENTVDKNIVPLICAMNDVFDDPANEEGNYDRNDPYTVMVFFHWDFMFALLNGYLSVNEDGTISIHAHPGFWIVDPKTFDLPSEISSFDDRDD